MHNGEVLLLHPTSKTNADILPQVIDILISNGYRFGTLDELCGENTVQARESAQPDTMPLE